MKLFTEESEKEKLFTINIIETLKKQVEVFAENEDDAIAKAEQAWKNCEVILDENDFTEVKFKLKKVTEEENAE